jgi:hypothetical protein
VSVSLLGCDVNAHVMQGTLLLLPPSLLLHVRVYFVLYIFITFH